MKASAIAIPLLFALAACGNVKSGDDVPGDDMPGDDEPIDPTRPSVTASTDDVDAIHLSWTPAEGSSTYRVLRSESEDGAYEVIADGLAATAFDDTGIGSSDVKFYQVVGCEDDGTCLATSRVERGATVPGTVTLETCSRGTWNGSIACSWSRAAADAVIDGDVSYDVRVREAGGAQTVIATTTDINADGAAPGGYLYEVTVAVVSSETGAGPDSNAVEGYAQSPVIVYDDADPADTARAQALAEILATDYTLIGEAAGAMPALRAVLLPSSRVSSTYAQANEWAGLPMIVSSGFDGIQNRGKLRNLGMGSRAMFAMGPAVAMYDTIYAVGGTWGPGPVPYALGGYSEFGGYSDATVIYEDGDVFTYPLYATGYGSSPLEGTVEGYRSSPTSITAVYAEASSDALRLCGFDVNVTVWWACAQQDAWGWFGFQEPPDTYAGMVLFQNFVARFTGF
jgi:hypothetical protein